MSEPPPIKADENDLPECVGCRAIVEELPAFDEAEAKRIVFGWRPFDGNPRAAEVRRRWPRRTDTCLLCGAQHIVYASYMHYVLGDW